MVWTCLCRPAAGMPVHIVCVCACVFLSTVREFVCCCVCRFHFKGVSYCLFCSVVLLRCHGDGLCLPPVLDVNCVHWRRRDLPLDSFIFNFGCRRGFSVCCFLSFSPCIVLHVCLFAVFCQLLSVACRRCSV